MKKTIIMLIVLCFAFSFIVAGISCKAKEAAVEEATAEAGDIIAGVALPSIADVYFSSWPKHIERNAEERGWEPLITDADYDVSKQIQLVEDMVLKDIDILAVFPVSAEGMVSTVNKVWEGSGKKLPIISVNIELDPAEIDALVAHVGFDYVAEAVDAANRMVEYMDDSSIDSLKYVELTGLPGYSATEDFSQGWRGALAELKVEDRFTLLDSQPGDWVTDKAQVVMEDYLTRFGEEIEAVFSHNASMASGAVNALKAAGYGPGDIPIVSTGSIGEEDMLLVKEGWIMLATAQFPITECDKMFEVMEDIVAGNLPSSFFVAVQHTNITPDNVDDYIGMEQ